MSYDDSTTGTHRRDLRRLGNILAIVSFVLAGGLLLWLERWAWLDAMGPHIALVERVPVPAEVLSHRVDEVGTGPQGSVYPHVTYRYSVNGRDYESSVIRPPQFVNETGEGGTVRFDGPDRHQYVQALLDQYPIGQSVTAWIDSNHPSAAMLVQQRPSLLPFLWGLLPALFLPILWMFLAGVLKALMLRPRGRWLATGWSVLTLAGAAPVVWQFQKLSNAAELAVISRLFDVGIGLASVAFVASLLPQAFRSGISIGLILCFSVLGGLGTVSAAAVARGRGFFGWKADPSEVFVQFLEYSLVSGAILGLLIGIGAWRGALRVRSDEDDDRPIA